jgi:radical SAM superfamily enzyme with C-terminal helix-hairpin-helix motif
MSVIDRRPLTKLFRPVGSDSLRLVIRRGGRVRSCIVEEQISTVGFARMFMLVPIVRGVPCRDRRCFCEVENADYGFKASCDCDERHMQGRCIHAEALSELAQAGELRTGFSPDPEKVAEVKRKDKEFLHAN